mgnify:CR=1 FL=1
MPISIVANLTIIVKDNSLLVYEKALDCEVHATLLKIQFIHYVTQIRSTETHFLALTSTSKIQPHSIQGTSGTSYRAGMEFLSQTSEDSGVTPNTELTGPVMPKSVM